MRFGELPFIKPFHYVSFRFLFLSEICFFIPMWMAAMVFGLLATHLKGNSPFYVGLVGFGFNLPMLFGPYIGVIVDRYPRPKILRIVSITALLAALVMALLLINARPYFWIMFFIILIYGFSQAFYFPALITNTVDIISDAKVVGNGTSIINSTNRVMMFVGYGLGGLLLTHFNEQFTFWFNAALFFFSFIFLLGIKVNVKLSDQNKSAWLELKEGFAYLTSSLPAFAIVFVLGITGLLAWPYLFQIPVVNRYYLNGTPASLGFLLATGGIGGTIGAFWMSARKNFLGLNRIFMVSTFVLACALIGFAFCHSIWSAVLFLFVIDFSLMVSLTAGIIFIQLITPGEFQGRMIGIISMVSFGTIPIGSTLFYGGVGEVLGVMNAFAIAGIIILLVGIVYLTQLKKIRRVSASIFLEKKLINVASDSNRI